jgi:WD40 repeat protein
LHYCSGHSLLADGRLFVAGGHVADFVGLPDASIFSPVTESWTHLPDMNAGRWYPTVTTLPNGDVVVVSGAIDADNNNNIPQVWQPATGSWRDLTGAQLDVRLYPWLFVAPNGQIFLAGQRPFSRYLDTSGTGSWTDVDMQNVSHNDYGSAVMYGPGKIIVMGGSDPPVATAEVIDLNSPSPAWQVTASMAVARRQLNATLLPDGTVLVTGGSSGAGNNDSTAPVLAAELWKPATGTWTSLASSTVYRGYHSVAFLLPDGRVVTAGGTSNVFANGEIFSPPYLFQGPRPTISLAPTVVRYNAPFFVGSPDAANIARVTWVRLSSVTHSFNANQRFNELSFTQAVGGLQVTAPANGALCPPGHYLLFLLNGNGVPSVGKIVRIEAVRRRGQLVSE